MVATALRQKEEETKEIEEKMRQAEEEARKVEEARKKAEEERKRFEAEKAENEAAVSICAFFGSILLEMLGRSKEWALLQALQHN